jgi:hypothetical protein
MSDGREQVEKAADNIRAELLTTLHELDRRRHLALDLRYQVHKHLPLLIIVSAGVVLAVGLGVTTTILRSRARKNHVVHERVLGLLRAWENPQRIASISADRPLTAAAGRKVALALAAAVATQFAKRSAARLLSARSAR